MATFNFGGGAGPTMPREDYEKFFGRSAGLGGMFGAPAENQINALDAALRAQKGINYNARLQPLFREQSRMRPWELSQNLFGQLMQEAQRQRGADYTGPLRDALSQIRQQTGQNAPAYGELLKELEAQRGESRRVAGLPRGFDQKTIESAMNRIQSQAGRVSGDLTRQLEAKAAATGMGGGALNNAMLLANRDLGRNVGEATSGFMTEAGRAEQQGRFSQADSLARLLGLRGQTAGALGSQSEQSLQYQLPFMQALAQAGPDQARLVASILGQAATPAGQYGNLMLGQEQQLGNLAQGMAGNVARHGDLISNLLGLRGQAAGQRQQANIAGAGAAGDLAGRELKQYGVEAENYANAMAAQQLQDLMGQRSPMFNNPNIQPPTDTGGGFNFQGMGQQQAPTQEPGVVSGRDAAGDFYQSANWGKPQRPADTSQGLGGTRGPANTVDYLTSRNRQISPSYQGISEADINRARFYGQSSQKAEDTLSGVVNPAADYLKNLYNSFSSPNNPPGLQLNYQTPLGPFRNQPKFSYPEQPNYLFPVQSAGNWISGVGNSMLDWIGKKAFDVTRPYAW